ncbi:putative dimethylaniline monooxygenase [Truncatella angustata]|uniref:Dimethylaniline monooxygenase n=1 Tax=Truncatella angustata TaxID=152316 RepID=A0A9P8RKS9_9PEZI|nr:putative dimethylaniline monooxygenase [Truncatella angustata]KAH6644981.1 putative dimethylaniline monooxygenase [Truncatella angustata]
MSPPTTVAVIGAGSTGLSMLKTLREDGFQVTCFERRTQVGGLWAYTTDKSMTTALRTTVANISKYTCGMSDFPMPDKYPHHLSQADFQEYMESYAKHFDMHKDIVFGASLKQVVRTLDDTKWRLELEKDGKIIYEEFDKVALTHGYQTQAITPTFEGQEKFEGTFIHAQQYRSAEDFRGKKVVMVGLGTTTGDVTAELIPVASKVYAAHRRGSLIVKRWRKGTPTDLVVSWRKRQINNWLQKNFPDAASWVADIALRFLLRQVWGKFDPVWRLEPFPSVFLSLPSSSETLIPALRDGSLTSLWGLKRFVGPRSIEFDDGTIIEDVDAVICSTGYKGDFGVVPFLEKSRPANYHGEELARLWMNMFPTQYADSLCMLCHSSYGKSNGFSFCDVQSMAVSNVWRGIHPLPLRREMEKWVDEHQEWLATRWRLDDKIDTSMVRTWEFQNWIHEAAGTGMDNLGWGWKGWRFWFKDPKMSYLMNNGIDTAHAFRFFETGKRKTWSGARDAIIHMNGLVKQFPLQEKRNQ